MTGRVSHLNPDGLHRSPAFSQVVVTSGTVRTIYVGGQHAVDPAGAIVGGGDIGAQAARTAGNLRIALASAGARVEDVVKWTFHIVQGQPMGPAMAAFQQAFGTLPDPPTISVVVVMGLADPGFLLEVDAIAVVPEE